MTGMLVTVLLCVQADRVIQGVYTRASIAAVVPV
jgi:hypothetical protein